MERYFKRVFLCLAQTFKEDYSYLKIVTGSDRTAVMDPRRSFWEQCRSFWLFHICTVVEFCRKIYPHRWRSVFTVIQGVSRVSNPGLRFSSTTHLLLYCVAPYHFIFETMWLAQKRQYALQKSTVSLIFCEVYRNAWSPCRSQKSALMLDMEWI